MINNKSEDIKLEERKPPDFDMFKYPSTSAFVAAIDIMAHGRFKALFANGLGRELGADYYYDLVATVFWTDVCMFPTEHRKHSKVHDFLSRCFISRRRPLVV